MNPTGSLAKSVAPRPIGDPTQQYRIATWIFLRLLALVHLAAFASYWFQWAGLVGPNGILPAGRFFAAVQQQLGPAAYLQLPSLSWIFGVETFLPVLCAAGLALSLLLFAGIAPALCLALLWAAYLSLCAAGQVFWNFQWDALLLETTLLAVLLAPWSALPRWRRIEPPTVARLLLWWLLCRLMVLAGVVKLASGDSTWRDLTALTFHYETQPLPTPLAWYVHQLPVWWQRASCAGMFVIELVVPWFLFGPRRLRHRAALLLIALMGAIVLTGNYTFFNFLVIALCLFCFDDAWWTAAIRRFRPQFEADPGAEDTPVNAIPSWRRRSIAVLGGAIFTFTMLQALTSVFPRLARLPGYEEGARWAAPFRSLNNYGLFAVMTRPRYELSFEGSDDGRNWLAYEFPHKPGELRRRPTWVAPHQPRLDWQLWFAALGSLEQNRWLLPFCEGLLRGNPEQLRLLAVNPFPNRPPRWIRIIRYEYHFTDAAARERTGQWWRRTPVEIYLAPASLRSAGP